MMPLPLLFALLVACPAEQLGVELPKGGAQALSQEDLQRDVFMLVELGGRVPGGSGYEEGLHRLESRLDQMKTLPAFGSEPRKTAGGVTMVCTRHDGKSPRALLIAALDQGNGADASASALAGLISLAKAYDTPTAPPLTLVFCALPEPGGLDAYFTAPAYPREKTAAVLTLGPLAGPTLRSEEGEVAGLRRVHLSTGADPVHGTPEDTMGRLDFRVLQRNVERALDAAQSLQN